MKFKFANLVKYALLCIGCLIISCSDEQFDQLDIDTRTLMVLSNTNYLNVPSKSIYDHSFAKGSGLAISLRASDGSLYDGRSITNIIYRAISVNREGFMLWKTADPIVLSSTIGKVAAISPENKAEDPSAIILNYTDNIDWLYANVSGVSVSNPIANLTLKHAMAGLRLKFVRGNMTGIGNISNITVAGSGMAKTAVLNAYTGNYTSTSGAGSSFVLEDNFNVSSTPYSAKQLFVPNGVTSTASLSVSVDGIRYNVTLPSFTSVAGHVYEFTITIDEKSMSVQSIFDGNMSYNGSNQPVLKVGSYSVTLAGNMSNIAWAHSEGSNSATIKTVMIDKVANQLPACPTISGSATVAHTFSSDRTIRTISLTNITSDITLTFDGVATQLPVSSVTANGAYYLTADNYGSDKWEYGATDVFVVGKNRRYVVEPTNAGSSTVKWGGWPTNKGCADYSKADGSNSSVTLSTSADPSSWTGGAISEFAGYTNSGLITSIDIGKALVNFRNSSGNNSWFIPSCGEMALLYLYKTKVNEALGKLGGVALEDAEYWTSTERDGRSAWYINLSSGKVDNVGKLDKKKRRYLREI